MTDRDLLEEAATALYGDWWQTPLAERLVVSVRTVQRWVAGESPVPHRALVDLRRALEEHGGRLKRIARKLPREQRKEL